MAEKWSLLNIGENWILLHCQITCIYRKTVSMRGVAAVDLAGCWDNGELDENNELLMND